MAADVVADDANLAARGLAGDDVFEEGHELLAGVAGGGLAQYFAGAGVERSEQAECAVALLFETVALGSSWRQRQHPVLAVECLDRRLLVHAEHGSVRWRVQVQADHVGRLGLEVRVAGDPVGVLPVRPHAVLAPDALHGRERHVAEFGCQLAAAPVRRAVAGVCLSVRFRTRASSLATGVLGARPGCKDTNPTSPCVSNARAHFETNSSLQASSLRMSTRRSPSLQSKTHRARRASSALP